MKALVEYKDNAKTKITITVDGKCWIKLSPKDRQHEDAVVYFSERMYNAIKKQMRSTFRAYLKVEKNFVTIESIEEQTKQQHPELTSQHILQNI